MTDADCIHGIVWYDCQKCADEMAAILSKLEDVKSETEYEG